MSKVITVLGPIDPEMMGPTLMHEHIFIDLSGSFIYPEQESLQRYVHAQVDEPMLELLYKHPFSLCLDNVVLDNERVAVEELRQFIQLGGSTLVDCTVAGIGTDPVAVREVARKTGLHIVQGTGLHIELNHPSWVAESDVDELAEMFTRDVTNGIGGTEVRAGLIGEIGASGISKHDRVKKNNMTLQEEKALRAAARASGATGAAVAVHLDPRGQGAFEVIDILESEGMEVERMIMCHMDANPDLVYHNAVADRGVFIEYDHFGREYYASHMGRPYGTDKQRVELVMAMIEAGHARQLLLSQDVCCKIDLCKYGGGGYKHILASIVPALHRAGIRDELIDAMLIENPRRALAF